MSECQKSSLVNGGNNKHACYNYGWLTKMGISVTTFRLQPRPPMYYIHTNNKYKDRWYGKATGKEKFLKYFSLWMQC